MHKYITLKDQILLNSEEIAACDRICEWGNWAIERREQYIKERGLRRDIYIPNGVWEDLSPKHASVRIIRQQKYYDLLRLSASYFSGYGLYYSDFGGEGIQEVAPTHVMDKNIIDALQKRGDQFLENYQISSQGIPAELLVDPPARFGEVGIDINGRIINHDTYIYQSRIKLMHGIGVLKQANESHKSILNRKNCTIVEIGSGYGALSYHLSKIMPDANIILVDLPESLIFAMMYTSILRPNLQSRYGWKEYNLEYPRPGFTYVPNYEFAEMVNSGLKVDFVINTLSMSEMTADQVSNYGRGIRTLLKPDGVFYEQNFNNEPRNEGINAKVVLEKEFPAFEHYGLQWGGELSVWGNNSQFLRG